MTQHSLITRLKAVEEALEDGCCCLEHVAARFHEEMKGYRHAEHISLDNDAAKARVALSDLRELIKEAEGQEPVGVVDIYLMNETPIRRKTVPTYTALGEKP